MLVTKKWAIELCSSIPLYHESWIMMNIACLMIAGDLVDWMQLEFELIFCKLPFHRNEFILSRS